MTATTLPQHADLRDGIRNWDTLGNAVDGDCVVAAWLHLTMIHNLAAASSWKKLLYRLGYRAPHSAFALKEYADFLLTLNEVPSPTQGIYPEQFFAWLKATGRIVDYQQVPLGLQGSAGNEDVIRQAMLDWNGCVLGIEMTPRVYAEGVTPGVTWDLLPGDVVSPKLGHAVAMVAFSPDRNAIVTWGLMKEMTTALTNAAVYGCWVFK